ncbi:MAG: carboxypeptidase regulatory-like domain-containing protein [Flavobacteriaceae bacterium]|nr:carboxypeptidase regulatory-like domain-containing protein [Flavobacteriaceae bacterium]
MFSITGFAQVTTSSMHGNVYDDSNEALPAASVVAIHNPTGTKYGSTTNFDGVVNLRNMRVGGPYTISITYIGFQSKEITDVYLTLGQTFDFNAVLQADSQELQEVVVQVSVDNTFGNDRTGAETSVGRKELTTLPTISRSASDFTRLEPSSSGGSFGGRNDQYNNFSLDGSIFNNPFGLDAPTPGGQTGAQPISLDAIDQISVATAPYDVTLSGFTGASVNAVTKSGTNEFHGTVYGFYRNEDMTGDKVKGDKVFKGDLEQKQYGFSIGGPLVQNKLFFFANFEKDDRTDLGQSWIPNRNSGLINESRVDEQDLMDVSNSLAAIGYETGSYEGFTHDQESIKGILKLDWNINDHNRLALIYNFLDASKDKPAHPTAINRRGPDFNTLQFQNSGYTINNKIQSFLLELNSNITESATNKLQVGYTYFDDFRNPFSAPAPVINITKDGSPYIIAGHEPFSIHNRLDQRVFQFTDNLTFFQGDHTFTVGFSFEKFKFKNSFNLKGYGFDVFGSVDINDFDANNYVDALANAQNTFDTKNQLVDGEDGGWNLAEMNVGQIAFYLQDEWEVTDNFRLALGIRFDKPLYFNTSDLAQKFIDTENSEFYNPSIDYFDPDTGEIVNFDSTKMPTNDILISPRVGFNWDVNGDNSFKVRGGTGIFTGRLPFVWLNNQVGGVDQFFYQVVDPDFEWPQVWRTSLGLDYKFENGFTLISDISYTKDLNAVHVQNWGLNKPTGTLQDVDGRQIYRDSDISHWTSPWGSTERGNAYVLTNSDKGHIFNTSIKAQKQFENNLFMSAAYNYMNSKDVNSIEAEITGDAFSFNPALNNVNDDVSANSKYGDNHRFIGVISKKWNYGNDKWSTTISSFMEYRQGGRFSYTYGGDINNDGSFVNDLIYVPTSGEVAQMNFTGQGQSTAFNNFIEQDDYLKDRRGQYAERYGATSPWVGKIDVKFMQDYNFNIGDKVQTIQFSIDILNFGNMLNSDWGVVQQPNSVQPIGVSVDGDTKVPTYSFNGDLQKTFGYDASLLSRWQMQFGLRYIF